jgi:hypothetical protein
MKKRLDATIEVYSFPVMRGGQQSGVICHYANCPAGCRLRTLSEGEPVAVFRVMYKRGVHWRDDLERMRHNNYLFASDIFLFHDFRPDL